MAQMSPLSVDSPAGGPKRKGTPDDDVGGVDVDQLSPAHSVKSSDIQSAFALIDAGEVSFEVVFIPFCFLGGFPVRIHDFATHNETN